MSNKEEIITQFIGLTHTDRVSAETFLAAHDYDLMDAIDGFFKQAQGGGESRRPVASKPAAAPSMFGSFAQMNRANAHDSDDDEDANFFTGGEKSALQVENPNKKDPRNLVQDLLRKAALPQGPMDEALDDERERSAPPAFTGAGYKLGSTETASEVIADPHARAQGASGRVTRQITFWRDGFQVGEGSLYRYDNPANASYLTALNQGRAPLDLLDVKFGQDVDVSVTKRVDEDYVPPKRKVAGFSGSGQKLGSIVPGETPEPEAAAAPSPAASPVTSTALATAPALGGGDSLVQIRLANGKRIVHKFNALDPVSLLYDFVAANTSDARGFILAEAFPVKPIENSTTSIKDAGLINAVVVQRWT